MIWKLALAAFTLLSPTALLAQDEFEGIYHGTMNLTNGSTVSRTVPLQLSLVLTGDTIQRPDGETVQVIDGAFLVDGESGAFPFTRVSFDIADGRLDLRYSRPMMDIGSDTPASFRLIGTYGENGRITGRVFSGNRGPIGTFQVDWTNKPTFTRIATYNGTWAGHAVLPGGGEVSMSMQVVDAEGATINPADLEFEYTPGKLANVRWNNNSFSISNVSIDYLKSIITLRITDGSASDLSIEFVIDPQTRAAVGQIKSAYRGSIARFNLPPVQPLQN